MRYPLLQELSFVSKMSKFYFRWNTEYSFLWIVESSIFRKWDRVVWSEKSFSVVVVRKPLIACVLLIEVTGILLELLNTVFLPSTEIIQLSFIVILYFLSKKNRPFLDKRGGEGSLKPTYHSVDAQRCRLAWSVYQRDATKNWCFRQSYFNTHL